MDTQVNLSRELRAFVDDNIVDIRAESLRVASLKKIESIYMHGCIAEYGLHQNATWGDIIEAYWDDFQSRLNGMSQEREVQINAVKAEFIRFVLAKFLQLNKFTATPKEVARELNRIQQELEI